MSVPEPIREVMRRFGMYWPDADPRDLRLTADTLDGLGNAVLQAAENGSTAALSVSTHNQGQAVAAFAACWATYDAPGGHGGLPATAAACRAQAKILREYAGAVDRARQRIGQHVLIFVAGLGVGALLAVATTGLTLQAALAAAPVLIAFCAAVGVELSAAVAGIIATGVAFTAAGALEAALADVAVAQPMRVELFHDGGYSGGELASVAAVGTVGSGLLLGVTAVAEREVLRRILGQRGADASAAGATADFDFTWTRADVMQAAAERGWNFRAITEPGKSVIFRYDGPDGHFIELSPTGIPGADGRQGAPHVLLGQRAADGTVRREVVLLRTDGPRQ